MVGTGWSVESAVTGEGAVLLSKEATARVGALLFCFWFLVFLFFGFSFVKLL